jgi:transcriptional regulator with XRE-family HTH domain
MDGRLGKKIRELRLKKGATQEELAAEVGVDGTYISKIEKDRLPYSPSAETLRLIAKALDSDALDLFSLAQRTPPELQGFLTTPHATDLLRLLGRSDLSKRDWKAVKEFVEERVAATEAKAVKNRK